ncbi:MAG: zinc ribbon domain-containing protein [Oscillospiraceae bacterium]|nr:zinc ribbon domain-containing protein [Oscillospiraceae bacterium]
MKFCTHCGKQIHDQAVFCIYCGCPVASAIPPHHKTDPKSIKQAADTSMILGIIGIIAAWIFALAGHITSIIGIVYGLKEQRETGHSNGLICSIIGEVCSVFSSLLGIVLYSGLF